MSKGDVTILGVAAARRRRLQAGVVVDYKIQLTDHEASEDAAANIASAGPAEVDEAIDAAARKASTRTVFAGVATTSLTSTVVAATDAPTAAPTTLWDNKKKRKDAMPVIIAIIVGSVVGFCCCIAACCGIAGHLQKKQGRSPSPHAAPGRRRTASRRRRRRRRLRRRRRRRIRRSEAGTPRHRRRPGPGAHQGPSRRVVDRGTAAAAASPSLSRRASRGWGARGLRRLASWRSSPREGESAPAGTRTGSLKKISPPIHEKKNKFAISLRRTPAASEVSPPGAVPSLSLVRCSVHGRTSPPLLPCSHDTSALKIKLRLGGPSTYCAASSPATPRLMSTE